jgi:hypothetical protein
MAESSAALSLSLAILDSSRREIADEGADPKVRRVGLKLAGPTPPGCDRTT